MPIALTPAILPDALTPRLDSAPVSPSVSANTVSSPVSETDDVLPTPRDVKAKLDPSQPASSAIPNEVKTESALIALSKAAARAAPLRSEEHTSELQSLMRTSYAVFC